MFLILGPLTLGLHRPPPFQTTLIAAGWILVTTIAAGILRVLRRQ